jgi:hypothetical protein
VSDERGDVDAEAGTLDRTQVVREALEVPPDPGAQRLE